jgi:hypothetical protein
MKQKKQLAVLALLSLLLLAVGYFYFDGDKPVVTADAGSAAQNPQLLSVENPGLHKDGVEKARKTEYKSGGRNIFNRELPPPPVPRPQVPNPKDPKPPIVPPAPVIPTVSPLPAKFFGYGTIPNGTARVAFFRDGEDVIYVVKEGERLMNRFRILKIGNSSLDYEDVSSGLRGTAILEEQGTP